MSATVELVPGARYPWRASCACGWASRGYVAEHAARLMAEDHECPEEGSS